MHNCSTYVIKRLIKKILSAHAKPNAPTISIFYRELQIKTHNCTFRGGLFSLFV